MFCQLGQVRDNTKVLKNAGILIADRKWDEQIVVACGEKPAYGYRRVTWWLRRKERLPVNGKRVLRVMRERSLLVRSRRLRARRKKEWGRVEAAQPNQIWQSDMTKIWAGPAVGWAYLVSVIDCCTREIVGWNLSLRCRTEEALAAVEQAVLERLPAGSRESALTLTTDNGTQFTSARFMETLTRLGITHTAARRITIRKGTVTSNGSTAA